MATSRICAIPDCGKRHFGRGWCTAHYARWQKHGDPLLGARKKQPPCSVDGCDRISVGRALCKLHWKRWRRHGDPLGGGTPLGDPLRYFNETVLTYDGTECLIWPYARGKNGYAGLLYEGRSEIVSRLICRLEHGPAPTPQHEAAHSCGKGHEGCVSRMHISWKTHTQNVADMIHHGTRLRGDRVTGAKLTEASVRAIRASKGQIFKRDLAAKFGVSLGTIKDVQNRKSWAWLE